MNQSISSGLFAAAFVLTLLSQATAQSAAQRAVNEKDAVLVGFRIHDSAADPKIQVSAYQYETWLIVRDHSDVRVAAKLNDIIVPRKSGFWRIGVQPVCEFSLPDKQDHGNIHTEGIPYGVPIDQAPVLTISDPLCDQRTTARMLSPDYDPYSGGRKEDDPTECGYQTGWLEGILPDLVSMVEHYGLSEDCERGGSTGYEYARVESLDMSLADHSNRISVESVFGDSGRRAWNRAVRTSSTENAKEGCGSPEIPESKSETTDWLFSHSGGAWRAIALFQWVGGCDVGGLMGLQLPRRITGEPPLPAWFSSELRREEQANQLLDGWISPDGALVLKQVSEATPGMHAYPVRESGVYDSSSAKLGARLLELPSQDIIMVQWASGRYVDQWVSTLQAIAKRRLPNPIIKKPQK